MRLNLKVLLCSLVIFQNTVDAFNLTSVTSYFKNLFSSKAKNLLRKAVDVSAVPMEHMSTEFSKICNDIGSKGYNQTLDLSKMHIQLRTACANYSYPLLNPIELFENPEFDMSKQTVILATGFRTTINNSNIITNFAKAYSCRGDVNFLAIDASTYLLTLYNWAAMNTQTIGGAVARSLTIITQFVPVDNIHLIGHSLGAHIMGVAGRNFTSMTGKSIPRITGLDPAQPCFQQSNQLINIAASDARFVDIIHSDPGILGVRQPLGDADFYPDGLQAIPDGCYSIVCAHSRSSSYYAETVYPGNEMSYMARRCNSFEDLESENCSQDVYPMGLDTPSSIKGIYFLTINSKPPHGNNAQPDFLEKTKNCGLCLKNT